MTITTSDPDWTESIRDIFTTRLRPHKLLIVVGKTMSGKNTLIEQELLPMGYELVRMHTTRPQRPTETADAYHFEQTIDPHGLALREYDMVGGHVGYWTTLADLQRPDSPLIVNDVTGAIALIDAVGVHNAQVIYVDTLDSVIDERVLASERGRSEDITETKRRLADDRYQFRHLDNFFGNQGQNLVMTGGIFKWVNQAHGQAEI